MKILKNLVFILLNLASVHALAQDPQIKLDISDTSQFKSNAGVSIHEDYVSFDGKSGVLAFNSNYQPEGSFSISFWIKPNPDNRVQTLILKGELCPDGNPNYKGLTLLLGLTPELKLTGTLVSGEGIQLTGSLSFQSQANLSTDAWQHIVVIFDADEVAWKAFLQGAEIPIDQSFQPSREAFQKIAPSANALWNVGAKESYCNYVHLFDEYFNGSMKRIKIYDHKLTSDELASEASVETNKNYFILGGSALLLLVGFFVWRTFKRRQNNV